MKMAGRGMTETAMLTNIFEEISNLHSAWSRMDSMTRLGWLTGQRRHLNALADQFAHYIKLNGELLNQREKEYARELMEMSQSVDAEGAKTVDEIRKEVMKELVGALIKM